MYFSISSAYILRFQTKCIYLELSVIFKMIKLLIVHFVPYDVFVK